MNDVTYDGWADDDPSRPYKNVVEAALDICQKNPSLIKRVGEYKNLAAARRAVTMLDRARIEDPDRFPGAWRWQAAVMDTDGGGGPPCADVRACFTPPLQQANVVEGGVSDA